MILYGNAADWMVLVVAKIMFDKNGRNIAQILSEYYVQILNFSLMKYLP